MKLTTYLEEQGLSATAFAERLGVSPSTVTRAAKGEILPSRDMLRRIYDETAGAVTPNDFVGIVALA